MLSGPVLHFCQVPSKYSKGYLSYRADTKSFPNKTKGDNPKSKKARVVNLVCDKTKQREITQKVRKPELSFLNVTHHLVLIYISTKYHQNIPKGIQVTERTRSFMPTLTLTPTTTGSLPKTICLPHSPLVGAGWGGGHKNVSINRIVHIPVLALFHSGL